MRIGSGIYVLAARTAEHARAAEARGGGGPVRAPARALRDRGGVRGARRQVGEEGAGAGDRGGARRDAARDGPTSSSRCAATALFHLRIAEATGNGALVAVVKMLWDERTGPLYKQLEHHYDSPALWEAAMAEHRAVLKAIAAHDADGARGAMQRHLNRRTSVSRRAGTRCSCRITTLTAWTAGRTEAIARARGGHHAGLPHSRQGRPAHRAASTCPTAGPGEVLLRLGAGGICGSDLHYYFEGRNGSFVVREPLIPGHEASGVVAARRRGRHAREGRRQGRGVAVACVRPLRILPRGPRAAVLEHALPRQREPVPACAGHVPGVFRDGRAAVLSGRRRHLARRARVRRAAGGGPARASIAAATCSASRCWSPARARSAA